MSVVISELEAVRNAAIKYADGLQNGDIEILKKTFHPQAMMYGQGMIMPIQGLFDYVSASPAPTK